MKTAIVVDGYSAGNLLAPELASRGVRVVHVQSTETIWPVFRPSFRAEDYVESIPFDGDFEKLMAALASYFPQCVFAGTETGVELADRIAAALHVPHNAIARSQARRNKFEMVEAVRAHGLRAAKQIAAEKLPQILGWVQAERLDCVVVKPLESAGTDSVAICRNREEIEKAFKSIVGTTNKLGLRNRSVLVQEFLDGPEFFLNTVSRNGVHSFTDIWKYWKRSVNGRDCVYDHNELLAFDDPASEVLRPYVLGVLEALGVRSGPAHTEVILTAAGPVLVELGARLDGLSVPSVNTACVGFSPADLSVDAYYDVAQYERKTTSPYVLKKHAETVYLTSYFDGEVKAIPGESRLRELPSFFQLRLRVKPGGSVVRTVDYFTAPGFLTLVHADRAQVDCDLAKIREWERRNLIFEIA